MTTKRPGQTLLSARTVALAMAFLAFGAPLLADIKLTKSADLGFGQIVSTSSTGSVTVTPAGSRTVSGGAVLANAAGVRASRFQAVGTANTSYGIMFSSSATLTGNSGSMTLDTFTSSPSGSGNLGPSGSQEVTVGATLHVGASLPAGGYTGSYSVTVAYE